MSAHGRRGPSRRGATDWGRRAVAAVAACGIVAGLVVAGPPAVGPTPAAAAAAASDGSATSKVGSRGDIITSILRWNSAGRPTRPAAHVRCSWRTLSARQLEWLVAMSARGIAKGETSELAELLVPLSGGGLPEGELQALQCGTEVHEIRFVERVLALATVEHLQRQMVTRLPAPDLVMSPSAGVAVPLGLPVFVAVDPGQWQPVRARIDVDGTTAEVEAVPVSLRVISGDPQWELRECPGPGRVYSAGSSAVSQSALPDACTIRYSTATARPGTLPRPRPASGFDRPGRWLGTLSVVWDARWRVDGGDWQSLGPISRTRLFDREVIEVSSGIEHRG